MVEVSRIPNDGEFKFLVENYSRRNEVENTAHCEGGEFETVPYTITIIDRGRVTNKEGEFKPFSCDLPSFQRAEASRQEVYTHGN